MDNEDNSQSGTADLNLPDRDFLLLLAEADPAPFNWSWADPWPQYPPGFTEEDLDGVFSIGGLYGGATEEVGAVHGAHAVLGLLYPDAMNFDGPFSYPSISQYVPDADTQIIREHARSQGIPARRQPVTPATPAWPPLPLSPCCYSSPDRSSEQGPASTKSPGSKEELLLPPATNAAVSVPKLLAPYEHPARKHPDFGGWSWIETLPTELLQHISSLLDDVGRAILTLTSKEMQRKLGTAVRAERFSDPDRITFLCLLERDCDHLVYCHECRIMHSPLLRRECPYVTIKPRACEERTARNAVCVGIRRHMVRWATNLHEAGKLDSVKEVCSLHLKKRHTRQLPIPNHDNKQPWIEARRDVRVAERTHHILVRTRHIVNLVYLDQDVSGLPTHRSIYYLTLFIRNYLRAHRRDDICRHKVWADQADMTPLFQLRNEFPTSSSVDADSIYLNHREKLEAKGLGFALTPIRENDVAARVGGCCLFHPVPCPDAPGRCNLPTRGVVKSCEDCFTDYMWDMVYKEDVMDEDGPLEDANDVDKYEHDGKKKPEQWRERVFVFTTWKNLGHGCKCTEHIWESHSRDCLRSEPAKTALNVNGQEDDEGGNAGGGDDVGPSRRLGQYGFGEQPGRAHPREPSAPQPSYFNEARRSEWAGDIYRAFERKMSSVV